MLTPSFSNAHRSLWNLLPVAILVLACLKTSSATAQQTTARPNVIVILADDLGYGDVGYQGCPDIATPNIDRLAKEGITFTNMRANCTVCSPTRAALLTGRYADRVGVPGVIRTNPQSNFGFLSPDVPTIANRLSDVGYHTAIVGKWHLGLVSPNTPNERGFDLFHGFLGDMMDDYYNHRRGGINFMRHNDQEIDPDGHATELFTEWSIDYLTDRSKQKDDPFFLYLAYNAPHFPIQPPTEWLERTKQSHPEASPARQKNIAFVEHLDANVGKLLAAIDQLDLRENTLVAFTSDNGGSIPHAQRNLPWRDGKQSHYDGGLRVPFIIRPLNRGLAGTTSDYAGLTFDLYATTLKLAGTKRESDCDAVSLTPILDGKAMPEQTRPLYFVRREGNPRYCGMAYHALIKGNWKLVQNTPFSALELYDLSKDPEEQNDLINKAPKIANELKRDLIKHIQRGGQTPWQSPFPASTH